MRYLILILVFLLAACQTAEPTLSPTAESAVIQAEPTSDTTEDALPTEPTEDANAVTVEAEATPDTSNQIIVQGESEDADPVIYAGPTAEGIPNLPADEVLPPVGEIVLAAATAEPDAANQPFDYILYTQDGGPSNASIIIEVYGDGRVVRNGESLTASPDAIAAVDQKIKEISFFNIQGIFTTAGAAPDIYRYTLTVESELGSKMIRAQDGYTPQPLLELFSQVVALTEQR